MRVFPDPSAEHLGTIVLPEAGEYTLEDDFERRRRRAHQILADLEYRLDVFRRDLDRSPFMRTSSSEE